MNVGVCWQAKMVFDGKYQSMQSGVGEHWWLMENPGRNVGI